MTTGLSDTVYRIRGGNATDGVALPLDFAVDPKRGTRMLADAPESVVQTLTSKPVTLNLHHYSLLANESRLHPNISSVFRTIATNTVDGVEFVSMLTLQTQVRSFTRADSSGCHLYI